MAANRKKKEKSRRKRWRTPRPSRVISFNGRHEPIRWVVSRNQLTQLVAVALISRTLGSLSSSSSSFFFFFFHFLSFFRLGSTWEMVFTEFYSVSPSFHGFPCVLTGTYLVFDFTALNSVFTGFYLVLLCFTRFYSVLPSLNGVFWLSTCFYWVLPSFLRFI